MKGTAPPRPAAALPTLLTLLLAGCCAGPSYSLLAWEDRLELQARERYAVVATVLDDEHHWAFGEPAAVISAHSADYRPPAPGGPAVGAPRDAPPRVARALQAAELALRARGYRPSGPEEPADFVVQVGVTEVAGALQRVALHVGGTVDGAFAPRRTTLEARVPDDDPCEVEVEELVRTLLDALPERGADPKER